MGEQGRRLRFVTRMPTAVVDYVVTLSPVNYDKGAQEAFSESDPFQVVAHPQL